MPADTAAAKQDVTSLEVRRIIRAPRERVFQAWTTPADVRRWSAPGPIEVVLSEIDLRVGGRYRLEMREPNGTPHDAYGEYLEVDPPIRVAYTWNWVQEPDVRDTVVTVEFHDLGVNGTEVVLRHEGLTKKQAESHTGGWTSILEKLGSALA